MLFKKQGRKKGGIGLSVEGGKRTLPEQNKRKTKEESGGGIFNLRSRKRESLKGKTLQRKEALSSLRARRKRGEWGERKSRVRILNL